MNNNMGILTQTVSTWPGFTVIQRVKHPLVPVEQQGFWVRDNETGEEHGPYDVALLAITDGFDIMRKKEEGQ